MYTPSFRIESLPDSDGGLQNFEGPLSLILQLLNKNKIEIRDICISDILEQYNAQIKAAQESDLDVASEFIQMASYLLYIKSVMLLTGEKNTSELEELILSLEKLKARDTFDAVKSVLPSFSSMLSSGVGIYCRGPLFESPSENNQTVEFNFEGLLSGLLSVFTRSSGMLLSEKDFSESVPSKIKYSVREKCSQLLGIVKNGPHSLSVLYSLCKSRTEIVATFISILELCSLGSLSVSSNGDDYVIESTGMDSAGILDHIKE